jgi:hypothetical protein
MIALTYQPAFDPYHAIFRMIRLRMIAHNSFKLHVDHLRILDYFLLFPVRASIIRMAPRHSGVKRHAITANNAPYGKQPDDRGILRRMKPMQIAALETLAMRKIIDAERLALDVVFFTALDVPPPLRERAEEANSQAPETVKLITVLASEYGLLGVDGLKARTGLMEYRYDAV